MKYRAQSATDDDTDFCLIPLGTPTASVSQEVAAVQKLLKRSGLVYHMHSAGTTVGTYIIWWRVLEQLSAQPDVDGLRKLDTDVAITEGPWDKVMRVIGQCHSMLHTNGVVRIQSDIRVGSRTDKNQSAQDKVDAVNRILESGS